MCRCRNAVCSKQSCLGRHACLIFLFGLLYTTASLLSLSIGCCKSQLDESLRLTECLSILTSAWLSQQMMRGPREPSPPTWERSMKGLWPVWILIEHLCLDPQGNQLCGILALSVWAMCLEFLRKVGAQLFVKHRKNYQEDLEMGIVSLFKNNAW